ncbi:hypothetical protein TNIN_42811 [Trichonephila inaurata madagascariensis]|uniref:Uncharacterized protein n=1 Tax=Trichonephila inaurata madagascariensis TaxID=2747483 RepID=A0A8X7CMV3_9ARAC|nr:hypothetical protein TNIN_42811 [Trichonephila inaurata madagascariensis]
MHLRVNPCPSQNCEVKRQEKGAYSWRRPDASALQGAADIPSPSAIHPPTALGLGTLYRLIHPPPTKRSTTFGAALFWSPLLALCRLECEGSIKSRVRGRDDQQEAVVIVGGEKCCRSGAAAGAWPLFCSSPFSLPLPYTLQVRITYPHSEISVAIPRSLP